MDHSLPHHHHDIPPAGMGGTYQDWLRYQQKQERQQLRIERQEQAQRVACHRSRAKKAARTRRTRRNAKQFSSTLRSVLVAGVAVVLLVAGTLVTQSLRKLL